MASPLHAVSARIRLIGVLADPVAQARAPDVGNALLQSRGQSEEFVIVPMQVADGDLEKAVLALRALRNLTGFMVSMPHKQKIMSLLDSLSEEAMRGGAVNVVRRTTNGMLAGHLLDGEGFVGGLLRAGHEVKGRTCLLAGAGGAASAIAYALARHGCASLTVLNRTLSKAQEVAERVRLDFPNVPVRTHVIEAEHFGIAINGTSLGMRPGDALPFGADIVERSELVAECVIAPEITPLLKLAAERGRKVHKGLRMLEAQIDELLAFVGAGPS